MLIKSIFLSIPPYFICLFHSPTNVTGKLERLQRNLLWDSADETRKLHLVQWEKVTTPKNWGGLGVKNLKVVHSALLGEMVVEIWDRGPFFMERVIVETYGLMEGGWRTNDITMSFGCGLWRNRVEN